MPTPEDNGDPLNPASAAYIGQPNLCRLCGDPTEAIVNIRFQAMLVCNGCCLSITKQTVASLTGATAEGLSHPQCDDGGSWTDYRNRVRK